MGPARSRRRAVVARRHRVVHALLLVEQPFVEVQPVDTILHDKPWVVLLKEAHTPPLLEEAHTLPALVLAARPWLSDGYGSHLPLVSTSTSLAG